MLNCEQCNTLQFDYLDDLLSKEGKRELEEHLATCPICRTELERRRKTIALIREVEFTPPKSLAESVLSSIRREKAVRRKKITNICATAAACVVLAMALAVLPYVNRLTRQDNAEADMAAAPEELFKADMEMTLTTGSAPTDGAGNAGSTTGAVSDSSLQYSCYDSILTDEIYDKIYTEENADDCNEYLMPEAEQEAAAKGESAPAVAAPQANGYFSLYVGAYCPELEGNVSLFCLGSDPESHLGDHIKEAEVNRGANYTRYVLPHSAELADSLSEQEQLSCYSSGQKGSFIVYVEIHN